MTFSRLIHTASVTAIYASRFGFPYTGKTRFRSGDSPYRMRFEPIRLLQRISNVALSPPIPTLQTLPGATALCLSVRGIPVRRPTILPPASFRRTLLCHPCLWLPFASIRLGLDFAQYVCHNIGHHHIAAGPRPGTQHPGPADRQKRRLTLNVG